MLLEAIRLRKSFGGLTAVNNVTMSIEEGEIVALIGPNGAGKTTLLNLVSGTMRADSGAVYLNGQRIDELPAHRICRLGVARTFQNVRVFGRLSLEENVAVALLYGRGPGSPPGKARTGARHFLELVGLADRAATKAEALPYVDMKKLELARALATEPRLLLLDEVMAGLSRSEMEEIGSLIQKIKAEAGLAILFVEHVMGVVRRLAQKVIVMNFGEKIAEGPPAAVMEDPRVVDAYLGKEAGDGSLRRDA